jgi:hypothetical protein
MRPSTDANIGDGTRVAAYRPMTRAWPVLAILVLACGNEPTSLDLSDGAAGSGAGAGGTGGPFLGRPDASFNGTGGSGGSAGMMGTGGSGGSAGMVGTGGAGGSAGMMGTGGSGGGTDAGAPDAAIKKDAISTTDATDFCEDVCRPLETAYAMAVQQEMVCMPGAAMQCLHQVPRTLACGCAVWVNQRNISDPIQKRWTDMGCNRCVRACPAIACLPLAPGSGTCNPLRYLPAPGDPARPIVAPPPGQCGPKQ